jgi:hypothetical protein
MTAPPRPQPPPPVDPRTTPLAPFTHPTCVQWCGWRYDWRDGRWTKPPRQITGQLARNDDSRTWASFPDIWPAVERGRQFDGIGLMLLRLRLAVLDLDGVRNPRSGAIVAWACELLDRLGGPYAEITPSQHGLRIIGVAPASAPVHIGRTAHPSGIGAFEVYFNVSTGRYITVSGHQLPGTANDMRDIAQALRLLRADKRASNGNGSRFQASVAGHGTPVDLRHLSPSIAELIARGTVGGVAAEHPGAAFHRCVIELRRRGYSVATALATFEAHPNGVPSKIAYRLERELRRSWAKPLLGGALFDAGYEASLLAEAAERAVCEFNDIPVWGGERS